MNGELNPCFQPCSVDRIGRFLVSSVYVPGPNTSASRPSLTKTALCPSRTTSFAWFLISLPWRGKRQMIVSRLSSRNSTMSISWPRSFSMKLIRTPSLVVRDGRGQPGRRARGPPRSPPARRA
ncbi:Uncharacterised protein [Mycobacteroides abscessus]|nr:Uncharacterised protein [Mycobacteroides abscessus]